jgi:hypothetical protein
MNIPFQPSNNNTSVLLLFYAACFLFSPHVIVTGNGDCNLLLLLKVLSS